MQTLKLQIALIQFGDFHEGPKQADFERVISVNRNDQPFSSARFNKDMMAALNSCERPALALDDCGQLLARDLLHKASSMTRSLLPISASGVSTESHPSAAS